MKSGQIASNASLISFLDRFFMSRIGVRFLFQQHLHLAQAAQKPAPADGTRWTGAIDSQCERSLGRRDWFGPGG